MDLIQLKMPPENVPKVADAIERDLAANPDHEDSKVLRDVLAWLRYRHVRWTNNRPDQPAE